MSIPRMRTLPEAYDELKRLDPNTAYTLRALRRAVNEGKIPVIRVGNKRLINLDNLFNMLSNADAEAYCTSAEGNKGIRRVV